MKPSPRHFALRTTVRLTLATIAFSTLSVHASEPLEPVTVTANRMPSQNVLAPNTVITRADIERLQINDLPSLLSRQPGIDVTTSGGLGKISSIYMRGTDSGHVLVLIDGVKWQSATSGSSAIQHFPVEQIERIEIVRGPRSGLYGAEAIGGVIQIFTRQGQSGTNVYAKAGYGTHNSKQLSAGINGGNDTTQYNVSVNHQSTDGIDSRVDRNPDKDGYRNNSISAKLTHKINDDVGVGINLTRIHGYNQFDGFSSNARALFSGESVQQVFGSHIAWDVNDLWSFKLDLAESRDESESFKNSESTSVFNTRHRLASLVNTFTLNEENSLNIGLDYDVDDVDSTSTFTSKSRRNKAVFIGWQGQAGQHSWLVSARHDNNEAFGHYNSGTAEWGIWLDQGIQLTANIGTAFKAPTFNDLYFPFTNFGFFTFEGNPSLQPEKSRNFGVGLNIDSSIGFWSLQAFKNNIRDLIALTSTSKINVDEAEIQGVEVEYSAEVLGWDLGINATILNAENTETGKTLRRRAEQFANINLDRNWGKWSTGLSWKMTGHRYDDADNTERLGGYALVDLRVNYQVAQDWSLQASMNNVFDKEYETVKDYNSLDRTLMVSVSYQP